jgi:hypothetical protein
MQIEDGRMKKGREANAETGRRHGRNHGNQELRPAELELGKSPKREHRNEAGRGEANLNEPSQCGVAAGHNRKRSQSAWL